MSNGNVILITGSGGLVGREACEFYLNKGYIVVGIDNDMRSHFFGNDASTRSSVLKLSENKNYIHHNIDIRNKEELSKIFFHYNLDIKCIIHTAAQPSHDWAVKDPLVDFNVNCTATLYLLELTKKHSPDAVFIFMSTNKVYGDNPNKLEYIECDTRWEPQDDKFLDGFTESFSIDNTKHSLFGCSKAAADIYVQEYGKYFGLKTVVFRGGCLTGSKHKGAELHGFLNYLVRCAITDKQYRIIGYKGKQVRDNIHSFDLINAFNCVLNNPPVPGEVFNIGGSRVSNCSILEAINDIEYLTNKKMNIIYDDTPRSGDHIWWISDISKFKMCYPKWNYKYNITSILQDIINNLQ